MRSRTPAHRRILTRAGRLAVLAGVAVLAGCAQGRGPPATAPAVALSGGKVRAYNRPYQVRGLWYTPRAQPGYDAVGRASWYSYESPSRTTANGEPFDIRVPSAAHTTLPIPSWLEVTNLDNGRRARVRLNDRGPFVSGRLLDVSRAAAVELGFVQQGTARVRVRYLGPAAPLGGAAALWASAAPSRPALVAPVRDTTPPPADPPPADPRGEVAQDALADDGAATSPATPSLLEADAAVAPPARVDAGAGRFEVQAAAFADRANAERAAARLSSAGRPRIEPLQRGEAVLYRVLVGAWPQAGDAATARRRVLELGFADARVVAR